MSKMRRYGPPVGLLAAVVLAGGLVRLQIDALDPLLTALRPLFAVMLGVTVIAALRNGVGVETFGVFGPAIIALSWISLGPLWGFLLTAYIFVVATTTRLSLVDLPLGTPHRVGTVLVTTCVALVTFESLAVSYGLPTVGVGALFPVVLSSWYGDRYVSAVRNEGWGPASNTLAWTLFTIGAAYVVSTFDPLVGFVQHTPESWGVLAGLNVALGLSVRVRLSEYARFDTLRRSIPGGSSVGDVLTMRIRNREYVERYNPNYLLANLDKIRTKESLHALSIPTPKTHLALGGPEDADDFDDFLTERDDFVVKPAGAFGGEGILVVAGREGDGRYRTSKGTLDAAEIRSHVRTVLDGVGARGYQTQASAIVEERVVPSGTLRDYCGMGVPDVRVIVLKGVPVMTMARLPTEASNGTANLHGGAVGVGLSIADGTMTGAYRQSTDEFLKAHPDTGLDLSGLAVPDWQSVLEMASRAATASGLGYAGVDIVFDETRGPLVLEVNRRPGLGIQNANMSGLRKRLRYVEARLEETRFTSAAERVVSAMEWSREAWHGGGEERRTVEATPMGGRQ